MCRVQEENDAQMTTEYSLHDTGRNSNIISVRFTHKSATLREKNEDYW
jgi:hypothetical protein